MTAVSRRGFVAGAMVASAIVAGGAVHTARAQPGKPLLLYDADLQAGERFALRASALGGAALALEGDRIRQMRGLLAEQPSALFGVTRHGDEWLVGEIAREAGYRRMSLIQHRVAGDIIPSCAPEGASIATLARLAGSRWPEAFAELAMGGIERCDTLSGVGMAEPAFSWVLTRAKAA